MRRGAEARVYLIDRFGMKAIRKERIVKRYMHPQLDSKLRRERTIGEARTMHRLKRLGVCVPHVYDVDLDTYSIVMEYIEGRPIAEVYDERIWYELGLQVAIMHKYHEVHGDLNVSNVIVNKKPCIIDFGLAYKSSRIEDKAVDLHTLRRSMLTIEKGYALRQAFLRGYDSYEKAREVIKREEEIRKRGRYKRKGSVREA